ncbi:hypothetical protein NNL38_01530 [Photobacterium atrarenae]|uniref:DUF6701 domain-containing protein n=1 Tax=Photobacterium atrarenae TaxID=865757 RepID=A0ABY5GGS0_9GAMM|nr:DUF6701 domain-containing protein [Photobacterium atrarenae]UTV28031.1 hypothetical protein NNL38_01530 [Photobacterium atrarenae]
MYLRAWLFAGLVTVWREMPPGTVESQPWLLYNWRDKGGENPSALVTFGAYRGNDRVIYRGEKGINILLNERKCGSVAGLTKLALSRSVPPVTFSAI